MPVPSRTSRIGVILAAGRGRRMGRTKQLATWATPSGTKPLAAAAYDAIRPICDEMIVVLGHEADAVADALGQRPFHRVPGDADLPMFESVRAGLKRARAIDSNATVVLQPGDHPEVSLKTLEMLAEASVREPTRAAIPQYGGRGGHPVFIPSNIVELLLEVNCPTGLGDFWITHPELCVRVPIDDAGVLRDIDTQNDLPR